MFTKILVAVDDVSQVQAAAELVRSVAAAGESVVRVLHLRVREVSGHGWHARESRADADLIADAATFELRMAGLAVGGAVRYVAADRVAEAILAEAAAFGADLIVLGAPRRSELLTRVLGSVTLRVIRRARCPVLVAARRSRGPSPAPAPGASAGHL